MSNSNLALVKFKRSLLQHQQKYQSQKEIIAHLENIVNLNELKRDLEFLQYVCNLTQNSDIGKDVELKDVVKSVFISLFPELNNDQDLALLSKNIDYLKSNKRIKRISFVYSTMSKIGSWAIKKLL